MQGEIQTLRQHQADQDAAPGRLLPARGLGLRFGPRAAEIVLEPDAARGALQPLVVGTAALRTNHRHGYVTRKAREEIRRDGRVGNLAGSCGADAAPAMEI